MQTITSVDGPGFVFLFALSFKEEQKLSVWGGISFPFFFLHVKKCDILSTPQVISDFDVLPIFFI